MLRSFRRNCGSYANITLDVKALWTSSVALRIRSLDVGQNAFRVDEDQNGDIDGISVLDLMSKHRIDHIDLFKIDIEGSERALFEDPLTPRWLSKVRMILIEDHDQWIPGCTAAISNASIVTLTSSGHLASIGSTQDGLSKPVLALLAADETRQLDLLRG